jgi:hypothetical protein
LLFFLAIRDVNIRIQKLLLMVLVDILVELETIAPNGCVPGDLLWE